MGLDWTRVGPNPVILVLKTQTEREGRREDERAERHHMLEAAEIRLSIYKAGMTRAASSHQKPGEARTTG